MKNHTAMLSEYCPHGRQRGFSLIEMMIALTIGLLLLIGLSSLFMQQSASRNELEKSSRQIENGRYAMQILQDNIEHAGFYSEYTPRLGSTTYTVPTNPCDATVANLGWATPSTIPVPIFGYVGPGTAADPTPTGCLPNYQPNTAVLVVRRTATPFITGAPLANTLYMQTSRCGTDASPFIVDTVAANFIDRQGDCATPARLRQYLVNIYYISQCSTPTGAGGACAATDDNGKWIPTLMLVQNGAAPTPLVEGIENMQFNYGLDTTNDGSPDTYTTTTTPTLANWPNVMTVRVSLLARNIDTTPNYADAKSYSLGSVTIAADGNNHKRHVYSELVRAINPIGWRCSC
jgi:type IV pilus assembly protein PilW